MEEWLGPLRTPELRNIENLEPSDIIKLSCASIDLAIGLLACFQFVDAIRHKKLRERALFFAMFSLSNLTRSVNFVVEIYSPSLDYLNIFSSIVPTTFYISSYTVMLYFWIEIYYRVRFNYEEFDLKKCIQRLRNILFASITTLFTALVGWCVWFYLFTDEIWGIFTYYCYVIVTALTITTVSLVYGLRLWVSFHEYPVSFDRKSSKIRKIGCLTATCCGCFLARAMVLALFDVEVLLDKPIQQITTSAFYSALFYLLFESLPSVILLVFNWKSSDSHHHRHHSPLKLSPSRRLPLM